jgi:hypothetical protein
VTFWINEHLPGVFAVPRRPTVDVYKDVVQKLANAFVKTMHFIANSTADQITGQMPPEDYTGVGKAAHVQRPADKKGIYTPDGITPAGGPQTVLNVLSAFEPTVRGHNIDLTKTRDAGLLENVGARCEHSPLSREKGLRHGGQCQAGGG